MRFSVMLQQLGGGMLKSMSIFALTLLFALPLTTRSGRGSIRRVFRSLPTSSTDHGPGANNRPLLPGSMLFYMRRPQG